MGLFIGIMSGTGLNSIDIALCSYDSQFKLESGQIRSIPLRIRRTLKRRGIIKLLLFQLRKVRIG